METEESDEPPDSSDKHLPRLHQDCFDVAEAENEIILCEEEVFLNLP
jgi:hypothetical protein